MNQIPRTIGALQRQMDNQAQCGQEIKREPEVSQALERLEKSIQGLHDSLAVISERLYPIRHSVAPQGIAPGGPLTAPIAPSPFNSSIAVRIHNSEGRIDAIQTVAREILDTLEV